MGLTPPLPESECVTQAWPIGAQHSQPQRSVQRRGTNPILSISPEAALARLPTPGESLSGTKTQAEKNSAEDGEAWIPGDIIHALLAHSYPNYRPSEFPSLRTISLSWEPQVIKGALLYPLTFLCSND